LIAKSSRLERQACATGSFDKQRKKYLFVIWVFWGGQSCSV